MTLYRMHRRLRRFRFLHRRSDCFRVERTQFPGGTFTRSRPAPFHGARVMGIFRQLSVPLPPYPSLMLLSVGKMGRMTGDAGMKPTQKFRLLVLALCAPYFLALLYGLVGHPHPAKWFTPLCLFYSASLLAEHPTAYLANAETIVAMRTPGLGSCAEE